MEVTLNMDEIFEQETLDSNDIIKITKSLNSGEDVICFNVTWSTPKYVFAGPRARKIIEDATRRIVTEVIPSPPQEIFEMRNGRLEMKGKANAT